MEKRKSVSPLRRKRVRRQRWEIRGYSRVAENICASFLACKDCPLRRTLCSRYSICYLTRIHRDF